jgi:hypothetical protein
MIAGELSMHDVKTITICESETHNDATWRRIRIRMADGSLMTITLFPSAEGMTIVEEEKQ